jgi:exopolysaccharide biosynthesis predicted pyruvyltransferase EpsI
MVDRITFFCTIRYNALRMITVREILNQYSSKRVYFEPLGGNHGDTLIEMGSRYLISQLGMILESDPRNAEVIVINGGGGFCVELWDKNLGGVQQFAQTYPDQPLIILPSSVFFQESNFASFFTGRSAPAYLFARDPYSFNMIRSLAYPAEVYVGLGDDMAFELRQSPFLVELRSRVEEKHILIIERFDVESATGTPQSINPSKLIKNILPGPLKHFLKKMIHKQRTMMTPFTHLALERLDKINAGYKHLPVIAQDVSSNVGFTFDQFSLAIAQAAVVVTTRLHAGILAAMLGKPTYFYSTSGSYLKIRGCYEHSMAHLPNVDLWERLP